MIIIPARLHSTRFPKKILCDINGVPMIIATANRVKGIDDICIACDDEDVLKMCKSYGYKAVLTSSKHQSGTDRINEAADILGLSDNEAIVNLQGDEPFIEPQIVSSVLKEVRSNDDAFIVSCAKSISKIEADDPNLVKVILDSKNYAIYFSRSKIPYERDEFNDYLGHIGIYGFKRANLKTFCHLDYAAIEHIEKLEQLRAIFHDKKIYILRVKTQSFGIDTQDDLKKALAIFGKN